MSARRFEVRYLKPAERDLYEIHDYIARDRPERAQTFLAELTERIEGLHHNAERGARVRDPALRARGFRALVVGRYVAFYKVEGDVVFIHRVLRGTRDWAGLL